MACADLDMDGRAWLHRNSEKTIFMKHAGEEWIMHGLFVDDMIHASTNDDLRDQFVCEYQADFDIILEDYMSSSLGMEIGHNKKNLTVHLDTYMRETLAEYKATVTKFLKPKQVLMQPGIMMLELEDCPESPPKVWMVSQASPKVWMVSQTPIGETASCGA